MSHSEDIISVVASQLASVPARRYVVAYSGGVDSHVLLHVMSYLDQSGELSAPLVAFHVHHGLSERADSWQAHCQAQCQQLNVPFYSQQVSVADGVSLEAKARQARYDAFNGFMQSGDLLLQAHHQNDQAETLLFRLFRGSGLEGAAGIPAYRPFASGHILRPLLTINKVDLIDYAAAQQLVWVEDESNKETTLDRNYIRHRILPVIEQRWPNVTGQLAAYTQKNKQSTDALSYLVTQLLAEGVDKGVLDLTWLRKHPDEVQAELLRGWTKTTGNIVPETKTLTEIRSNLIEAAVDAEPEVKFSGYICRRYQDKLYLMAAEDNFDHKQVIAWSSNQKLSIEGVGHLSWLTDGQGISLERLPEQLTVRFRQGGEECRIAGRGITKSVKKLLQEADIPPWLRQKIPLIYAGDELVAVADIAVCDRFAAKAGEKAIRLVWNKSL